MGDSISDNLKIGLTLIVIFAVGCLALSAATSTLQSGQEKLEKAINEIEAGETVIAEEIKKLPESTQYSSELIKDVDGNVVGVIFNGEGSESTNVVADSYVENADKVINTDTYNDNSIINEAEHVSYVVPLTVIAICVFIAVMYYMKNKFKLQHDKNTLEILKSPKITYKSLEVEELKKKYGEIEPDDKYREIDSGMEPL